MTIWKPALAMVGGLLVLVGSFLTWVTVDLGFATFSSTGMETNDGKLTASAAVVILLAGVFLATRGLLGTIAGYVGMLASFFAAIVLANDYLDVRERIADAPAGQATAAIGIGVWLAGIGCLVAISAFVWAIATARDDES